MSEWISVEDDTPVTDIGTGTYGGVEVITWDGERVSTGSYREGNTLKHWGMFFDEGVTHWMYYPDPPLREPPK